MYILKNIIKKTITYVIFAVVCLGLAGCSSENKAKDYPYSYKTTQGTLHSKERLSGLERGIISIVTPGGGNGYVEKVRWGPLSEEGRKRVEAANAGFDERAAAGRERMKEKFRKIHEELERSRKEELRGDYDEKNSLQKFMYRTFNSKEYERYVKEKLLLKLSSTQRQLLLENVNSYITNFKIRKAISTATSENGESQILVTDNEIEDLISRIRLAISYGEKDKILELEELIDYLESILS